MTRLSPHRALFWAALEGAVRHPLRLWVTVGCLVAVLTPFLVGVAILAGVREQARVSVDEGPDLLVTGYEHGRNAGVSEALVAEVRKIPQVAAARGRIVGRVDLEEKLVTLVGLEEIPAREAPQPGEMWIGASVAGEMGLKAGQLLAIADQQMATFRITRVLPVEAGLASARLAVVALADAQTLYATPGRVSDVQIWTREAQGMVGDPNLIAAFQLRMTGVPLRIQTRKLVRDYVDRGFTLKGGTFLALYVVALAVGIPALLVTSGFGMSTRRREVALLKMVGFSLLDLLEMAAWEVLAIALVAALSAFAAAWVWVRAFNGALIAPFFIAELEHGTLALVPASFGPGPLAVAFAVALAMLASGVIVTTWRSASASPAEVLR